jgi:hypothetical protein
LGLATLNRKDLPIVVTLGGVGPCFASLTLILQLLDLNYKLSDNILNCLLKTWFMQDWKVFGALVSPKGITKNS